MSKLISGGPSAFDVGDLDAAVRESVVADDSVLMELEDGSFVVVVEVTPAFVMPASNCCI